jgi:hypothetical protein
LACVVILPLVGLVNYPFLMLGFDFWDEIDGGLLH